jgi:hypothetical protein
VIDALPILSEFAPPLHFFEASNAESISARIFVIAIILFSRCHSKVEMRHHSLRA